MYIFWQLYLLCAFFPLLQIKLPPCMPLASKLSRNWNLLTFTVENSVSLGGEPRGDLGRGQVGKQGQKQGQAPAGDAQPLAAYPSGHSPGTSRLKRSQFSINPPHFAASTPTHQGVSVFIFTSAPPSEENIKLHLNSPPRRRIKH